MNKKQEQLWDRYKKHQDWMDDNILHNGLLGYEWSLACDTGRDESVYFNWNEIDDDTINMMHQFMSDRGLS